ncbi:LytTR family DNA-binding domain-containing protein [Pontibacter sp. SGAir0037]|uniref:LytTR family DNA-binding domain-containing protein n=1 Tax=Pontibacter sp. SGAir0037 TaxID=2571030 RepID=UPI0010CD49A5|nr:LytTR family DNA-binding domain-containing protein [Pontibacter sp. SGAir0037]QCR22360.1 hypothetical protein C1N53_08420 [Pontibacter sp. SGAir0037]
MIATIYISLLPFRHRESYFRPVAALAAAHYLTTLGEEDSLADMLLSYSYYIALAAGFVIAYALIALVSFATTQLDRRLSWQQQPVLRLAAQVVLGFALPAMLAYLLAMAYFAIFGVDILETTYPRYEFPFVRLLLVLLNLYYLLLYVLHVSSRKAPAPVTKAKEVFPVRTATATISVPTDTICCFYRKNGANYLRTFAGDVHLISGSLEQVELRIGTDTFFRVNRQLLVHYRACVQFSPLEHGKLELRLSCREPRTAVISQKQAPAFRKWLLER